MSDEEKKIEKITSLSLLAFAKPKEKISIRDKTVYLYDLSSDALEKLSNILKEKEDNFMGSIIKKWRMGMAGQKLYGPMRLRGEGSFNLHHRRRGKYNPI